ncbi:MaoC family dehydratase [Neorhizobium sp. JUb45]|uniref:MaoC family dehydratase n=1 Tax=Neorhizobium sp. JUb45 TaxID=2485113 RepID=UPI001042C85A|nr:MaoC family dehydratase [Neorhizobium sp. JUb45]TCQ99058.1 acyl dehydratase [Neorhizobium sp. JUb45]
MEKTDTVTPDAVSSGGKLFLEDLMEGQKFVSRAFDLSAEQIQKFASEFDPQPFHLDDEAAKGTIFGGLASSGWHVAAITMRLISESVPFANGIIGAGGEISWPRPTRPGDRLTVESEVTKITPSRSRPDRGIVVLRSATRNQHNEIVQSLLANLVVLRRQIVPALAT